jgi:hypothetical protein
MSGDWVSESAETIHQRIQASGNIQQLQFQQITGFIMSLRAERSNLLFSANFELHQPGDCFGRNASPRNDIKFVIC